MQEKESIGIVISTMDSPSTSKLCFVCTGRQVHKGEYVQANYSEGSLIAVVTDVIKINRYFENNDSVKEFENNNASIFDQFPTSEWEFLQAEAKPLGVYSKSNLFVRSTLPVSPGERIYSADAIVLSKFLHFKENGLEIGSIEHPSLEVKVDFDRLLQKHLAILAQSGAGKSYLTSVMIEELLDRKKEDGRIAVILFDVHGEYSNFKELAKDPKYIDYSSRTIYINSKDIRIGCSSVSADTFRALVPAMSPAQKRSLSSVLGKLNDDKKNGAGPYSMKDIVLELRNSDDKNGKDRTTNLLVDYLMDLDDFNLFGKVDSPSIFDIVQPGKLTIIDLSQEINKKKKQIILYYFANKLFYSRVKGDSVPPFLLIVEEAHQFAPERISQEHALAKSMLETIAREGRKFGASICLISQRPVHLSATILSQANTHIILRITNPYDLKHISESSEGLDRSSEGMITSLRVGEALLVGEATGYPVFFKVRKKKSSDSHLDVTLAGMAKKFEERKQNEGKDIEEFM